MLKPGPRAFAVLPPVYQKRHSMSMAGVPMAYRHGTVRSLFVQCTYCGSIADDPTLSDGPVREDPMCRWCWDALLLEAARRCCARLEYFFSQFDLPSAVIEDIAWCLIG